MVEKMNYSETKHVFDCQTCSCQMSVKVKLELCVLFLHSKNSIASLIFRITFIVMYNIFIIIPIHAFSFVNNYHY